MSVRMKLTKSKTGGRRAHHKKSVPELVATKTGVRRRHFVDPQKAASDKKVMTEKEEASKDADK